MDDGFLDTDAEHKHDLSVSSVGIVIEGEFFPDKVRAHQLRVRVTGRLHPLGAAGLHHAP
jgi:hypothetical protein